MHTCSVHVCSVPQGYCDWDGYDMYDMDAGSGEESRSQDVSWIHSREQCDSECCSFKDTTVNRDGTPRIWDDADIPYLDSDNDSNNVRVDVCVCVRRVGMSDTQKKKKTGFVAFCAFFDY